MTMRTWSAAAAFGAALLAAYPAPADDGEMGGAPPAKAAPAPAKADPLPGEDVLVLKDGTEVRGRITAEDDSGYAVKIGGSTRVVEKGTVTEVRRGAPAPEPEDGDGMGKAGKGPKNRKDGDGKGKDRKRMEDAPPLSEDGKSWAKSCIERLRADDPAIQRSAAEALRALGPAVVPLLQEAREAADEKGRPVFDRLIGSFEAKDRKGNEPKPGPDRKPMAGGPGFLDRVRTELALDEAASRTVGQFLLNFGRESREILADARDGLITYEDARTKVTGLRGRLRDEVRPTLTEEQVTKLDALLDDMAKRLYGGEKPKKESPPAK